MAKFTFADGTVFEGTAAELAEYTRLAGGAEAEQSKEIEGPVRVGDTIEITDVFTEYGRKLPHYTVGKRYEVVDTFYGDPTVIDDDGDRTSVMLAKYRIVARKEEAPAPAKPLPNEGDYVVFDESCCDITAGKPYKVDIRDGYDFAVIDDGGERNYFDEEDEYRIITDARELAFAKAGRKLDEFRAGDIVRFVGGSSLYGNIAEIADRRACEGSEMVDFKPHEYGICGESVSDLILIAPAEARVDSE